MRSKFTTLIIALLALGCSNDDRVNPAKTVVAFASSTLALNEADESLVVTVSFDQPAKADGQVEVTFSGTATNPEHYIVLPELEDDILILEFEKGDDEVQFLLLPINDDLNTGNKSVTIELSNPSDGFELGHHKQLQVSIADDDEDGSSREVAIVNFSFNSESILENNSNGIEVNLLLSQATRVQEAVMVAVGIPTGIEYGVHFYTEPAMADGLIPIYFEVGQISKGFMFYPINNNVLANDVEFIFTINDWSTGVEPGQQFDTRISLIDDEEDIVAEVHSIQDLRDHFETHEGSWFFPTDYYIEGVVTSTRNVINDKSIYIQDETAGIMLIFNAENMLKVGTKVRLNLKNAIGENVNNQKAMMGVEDRLGTTLATNAYIQPVEITIDDLIAGTYSGRLVKLTGVHFPQADGVRKWGGSNQLSDGVNPNKGIVTTYNHVDFSQQVLPGGTFSIIGVAGSWNHLHVINASSVQYF
ncbi:DUF5689 domain-containing protein [Ekhidna sp.]|uniref:DUF5689 domain-containing protein n=1 Tax=Ekhidna sp. TaxID=2608089 RepID=UPI003516C382